jgi:hypothetical protein
MAQGFGFYYPGYAGYRDDPSQVVYDNIMSRNYSGAPFADFYNTSVPSSEGPPGLGGVLFNWATKNIFGVSTPPFRLQNPWERPAGDLGAFGMSRFSGNTARMQAAGKVIGSQKRGAMSELLNGKLFKKTADNPDGLFDEDTINSISNFIESDDTGLGDMIVGAAAQFFGAGEDYGITGVKAARHAEGLMSGARRRALARTTYGSDSWKEMIGDTTSAFTSAARSLMYENNGKSFVRDEKFMRGLSETDVSDILERVASSADAVGSEASNGMSPEALKNRLKDVGGAAVKTLEAFKDLFGSASKAKGVLNALTGGGFANMTAESFENLTNTARGMMQLGYNSGVSHETVANMITMASEGVQGAMGYTASDVAGGYVNGNIVGGISNAFVAQELANRGVESIDMLSPVEQQQLVARSTFRATQFAGSAANKFMTAAVYAKANGYMSQETYDDIVNKFKSGDRDEMRQAGEMVAQAMNMSREDILDPTQFKIFADVVGKDRGLTDELADMAVAASTREDTSQTEKAVSGAALDRAQRGLRNIGISDEDITKNTRRNKVQSIVSQLEELSSTDRGAGVVLEAVKNAKTDQEALQAFEKAKGLLANGQGDVITTNANATAANALNDIAYESSGVGGPLADLLKDRKNATLNNGGLRKTDAASLFRSLGNVLKATRGDKGDAQASRIASLLENGDFATLSKEFGGMLLGDEGLQQLVLDNMVVSAKDRPDARESGGSSRMTVSKFSNEVREGKLERGEDRYNGVEESKFDVFRHFGVERDAGKSNIQGILGRDDIGNSTRSALQDINEILYGGDENKSGVERARELEERARKLTDEEMKALKDELGEEGAGIYNAVSKARKDTIVKTEGDITLNGRKVNLEDESLKKAVASAAEGVEGYEGKNVRQILEDIDANPESESARKFLDKFEKDGGYVQLSSETGDDGKTDINEAKGLSDLSKDFGGALVAVDEFSRSIKALGDKTPETAAAIRDLGAAMQEIVDSKESSNVSLGQAFAAFIKNPEEGTASLLGAAINPNASPEEQKQIVDRLIEIGNKLQEVLKPISENVEKVAAAAQTTAEATQGE